VLKLIILFCDTTENANQDINLVRSLTINTTTTTVQILKEENFCFYLFGRS